MVAFYGIKTISYLNVLKNKEMFQLELLFLKLFLFRGKFT